MSLYDVRTFGAAGDGARLDTAAIQTAINTCHAAGGGVVLFPAGAYVTGTLLLRSRVRLQLTPGARILGSKNIADYGNVGTFLDALGIARGKALIYAEEAENIGIFGGGEIDGRGHDFRGDRPMILRLLRCRKVRVEDVTLRDSAAWVQQYLQCEDVVIRGVHVHCFANGNNDGVNLDGSSRVRVSDCLIESGDDAFTLKCTTPTPCRDIVVTNCVFHSHCNAIKFGTESVGGFHNIAISNCVVRDTTLCGLALLTVDGAVLENVSVSNIVMNTVGACLFLRLGRRGQGVPEGTPDAQRPCGALRNINIGPINAVIADRIGKNPPPWYVEDSPRFPSSILGLPDRPIENVFLHDIDIQCLGGIDRMDPNAKIDEKPAQYPQWDQWGLLPAYGLYCRHVATLGVKNMRLRTLAPDVRPALHFEDVSDLSVTDLSGPVSPADAALIRLRASKDASLSQCRSWPGNRQAVIDG